MRSFILKTLRSGKTTAALLSLVLTASLILGGCGAHIEKQSAENATVPETTQENITEPIEGATEPQDKGDGPHREDTLTEAVNDTANVTNETANATNETANATEKAPENASGSNQSGAEEPAKTSSRVPKDPNRQICDKNGDPLQIVFFGDSQFGNTRDDSMGMATLIDRYCQGTIYNLAIGGTTAAHIGHIPDLASQWTESNFLGLVYAATGQCSPDFLQGKDMYEDFLACDFTQTDVFVICYGGNDFLSNVPVSHEPPTIGALDRATFVGALRTGVAELQAKYPDAVYILVTPFYAVFYDGDKYLGDGNIYANEAGYYLKDYANIVEIVAGEKDCHVLDGYDGLGINSGNWDEYLEDGLHLNAEGRHMAAMALSRIILRTQGYDVPSDTDLDTFDYKTIRRYEDED